MQRLLIFTLISTTFLLAFNTEKTDYPKNDFRSPINFPLLLSGTFAELRPNHFHGGLDIKPKKRGRQGDAIVAIADGYVSRIRSSAYGYGNAVYIKHENGYSSVYAHLQKFTPNLVDFVTAKQYENQSFEIDIMPKIDSFKVKKGEQIGYLGTTGGSLGPHLHFEIRENSSEKTVNPLLFGLNVSDNSPPFMQLLKVYELNHLQETINSTEYTVKKTSKNKYSIARNSIKSNRNWLKNL
jgi:murein DD-endopeptidase MepM/ murein hydrolase activator NlpD